MTLDTSIAIGKPCDVREVFAFCRTLLGAPEDTPVRERVCDDYKAGCKTIGNPIGIGLPALLEIYYGESCSDLHARLIRALGQWCDGRGLPWKWQNEYTGEWHDAYDGLDEFGDAHKATGADNWFRNTVMPAITSGGAR